MNKRHEVRPELADQPLVADGYIGVAQAQVRRARVITPGPEQVEFKLGADLSDARLRGRPDAKPRHAHAGVKCPIGGERGLADPSGARQVALLEVEVVEGLRAGETVKRDLCAWRQVEPQVADVEELVVLRVAGHFRRTQKLEVSENGLALLCLQLLRFERRDARLQCVEFCADGLVLSGGRRSCKDRSPHGSCETEVVHISSPFRMMGFVPESHGERGVRPTPITTSPPNLRNRYLVCRARQSRDLRALAASSDFQRGFEDDAVGYGPSRIAERSRFREEGLIARDLGAASRCFGRISICRRDRRGLCRGFVRQANNTSEKGKRGCSRRS